MSLFVIYFLILLFIFLFYDYKLKNFFAFFVVLSAISFSEHFKYLERAFSTRIIFDGTFRLSV
jgi:hypothetical protein